MIFDKALGLIKYCLVLMFFGVYPVSAIIYQAPVDRSEWRMEGSIFECNLYHPIPEFGEAIFRRRAGERVGFRLLSWQSPIQKGKAMLVASLPSWRHDRSAQVMGEIQVDPGKEAIFMTGPLPSWMLNQLKQGMAPAFERMAWYSDKETITVALSNVNFQKVYKDYLGCLSKLLPVNFDQIRRSFVLFDSGKTTLNEQAKEKLNNIAIYVKADQEVQSIYIDGHTDDIGRRLDNRELSKQRAESVEKYLITRGVKSDIMKVRFHGERYPIVKNNSSKDRARNRRATVRLEKKPLPSESVTVPPATNILEEEKGAE
ncbi:flagellar protein MotY [Zooshikella ganghwensis]|uniref:flagellar protein MotY n=1 Tax=Zooshikella ganghwensis TaxID=202772 RepID=UPI000685638A|nr:OmpA family protein [Zooshikella ganghwensis]